MCEEPSKLLVDPKNIKRISLTEKSAFWVLKYSPGYSPVQRRHARAMPGHARKQGKTSSLRLGLQLQFWLWEWCVYNTKHERQGVSFKKRKCYWPRFSVLLFYRRNLLTLWNPVGVKYKPSPRFPEAIAYESTPKKDSMAEDVWRKARKFVIDRKVIQFDKYSVNVIESYTLPRPFERVSVSHRVHRGIGIYFVWLHINRRQTEAYRRFLT